MSLLSLVKKCDEVIDKKWKVSIQTDFCEEDLIQTTMFGEVWMVKKIQTQEKFALKKVQFDKLSIYNQSQIVPQLKQLIACQHPKLLEFYGYSFNIDSGEILYLFELMDKNLEQYCSGEELNLQTIVDIFSTVLQVLKMLKKNNIVHGNLKPENILINEKGEIKVSDFGNVKLSEDGNTLPAETLMFAAPECAQHFSNETDREKLLMSGKQIFTNASDLFSLGLIMLRITGGIMAKFQIRNLLIAYEKSAFEKLIQGFISTVPEAIREIIEKILCFEAAGRPDINEINIDVLQSKQIELEQISLKTVFNEIKIEKCVFVEKGEMFVCVHKNKENNTMLVSVLD